MDEDMNGIHAMTRMSETHEMFGNSLYRIGVYRSGEDPIESAFGKYMRRDRHS
jgi:hypothetical protein